MRSIFGWNDSQSQKFQFSCSQGELENCLNSFIEENPNYSVPKKFSKDTIGMSLGYLGYTKIIFLPGNEEQMILVSLIKENLNDSNSISPSYISIRYLFDCKTISWEKESHSKSSTLRDTEEKFKTAILNNLHSYNCTLQ